MPPRPTFTADDFFILRTPGLPYELQEAWGRELRSPSAPPEGLAEAMEADRGALSAHLKAAVREPGIREALFVASPDLEATLDAWLEGTLGEARTRRVEQGLVRYLSRMSSRPTPFGLFAAWSMGAWAPATRLEVPPLEACRRTTRLDMDYLENLAASLDREEPLRASRTYRPNTSLYRASGRWRYAESRLEAGRGRDYHLVALEPTGHLEATLDRAAAGAPLEALAQGLVRDASVDLASARAFLSDLLEAQVLTSDLLPAVTGPESLQTLAGRLLDLGHPLGGVLVQVQASLQAMDARGPGLSPEAYRGLARTLEAFQVPMDPRRLFQVDLRRPAPGLALGPRVRQALEEAADLLRRLTPPRTEGPMERFKAAFRERYEGRTVPLMEVLDSEAGIGFGPGLPPGQEGSPLLENLPFPSREPARERIFTARDAHLMKRIQTLEGAQVWNLDGKDLEALSSAEPPEMPDAFGALAALGASSAQALEAGEFTLWMEQFSGPSGVRLLGRFCQSDPELEGQVRAHLAREEACHPGVVFAEVVHLPDGRTGNILARPTLRAYEIPFLGVSGVPGDRQIPPHDLLVSLVGDRVVLSSRRLGREIRPRLTSAHNFLQGLPVYRFLAHLQDQDGASGGWTWGCLSDLPFLPRVVRGRHVLCRARWRFTFEELQGVLRLEGPARFQAFQALRLARRLPRFVVLEEADNALWVDLDHPERVEGLLHLVAQRPSCLLREPFPGPGSLVVEGSGGHYCHELLVPFHRLEAPAPPRPAPPPLPAALAQRSFPPGSEWLYLKIYTGHATADRILLETLAPLLEATSGLWDKWFFIRYQDPAPHLRLRFQGQPRLLTHALLPWIHQALAPLMASGLCWKIQADTYERELERYGDGAGIEGAEAWFCLDSDRVLSLLADCRGDAGAEERWRLALQGADAILADLGMDLEARLAVVSRGRKAMAREFQAASGLEVHLGPRYRALRGELEALVFPEGQDVWSRHRSRQAACLAPFREGSGGPFPPLEDLGASFVHMHLNRLLRTSPRPHEFVILDFLSRLYTSRLARPDSRTAMALLTPA